MPNHGTSPGFLSKSSFAARRVFVGIGFTARDATLREDNRCTPLHSLRRARVAYGIRADSFGFSRHTHRIQYVPTSIAPIRGTEYPKASSRFLLTSLRTQNEPQVSPDSRTAHRLHCLAKDEDVVPATEGILENRDLDILLSVALLCATKVLGTAN